ncbi:MAG: glycosyltransferase family 4 protein [Promethearchaeota archaeon]
MVKKQILQGLIKLIDFFNTLIKQKIFIFLKKILLNLHSDIIYLTESGNWAIYWVGKYINDNIKKYIDMNVSRKFLLPKNKILHFGSLNCLIPSKILIRLSKSNKIILTWFHVVDRDERLKFVPLLNDRIDILHTANNLMYQKLIKLGFNRKKIVKIPLGVDLSLFMQYNIKKRRKLKEKFGLPKDKIIIGSFQKDGVGWGEGLQPKLEKGPDIFCKLMKNLSKEKDIHIFLTGPSRGYVKRKLKKYQISYSHLYLKNYYDIVDCYNTLDLYIITSREEGGPLALLESMATGVPVVSTKVGMVPEVIESGKNGLITEIDDIDQLLVETLRLINNEELRQSIIANGLEIVKKYDWEKIAKQYYLKIYKKFL